MKKKIAIILSAMLLLLSLCACGSSGKTDWEYLEAQGKVIVGYTIYQPMNYNENGKLTGFDTELAQAVFAELGLTPEFIEINWETKEAELEAKNLDCIWNGFTVDDERRQQIDFSMSYMNNWQVAVVRAENADKYKTAEDMAGAKMTAEMKSAGEKTIQGSDTLKNNPYTAMDKQTDALLEVKSGTSDIGVMDYIMAKATIGEGTDYSDLVILDIKFDPEEYAIGFRKNSPVTLEKVNAALEKLAASGKIAELARKYNLYDQLPETLTK